MIKDQLVFRIYANELLELIKTNLSKDLRRKYKIFREQKKKMKKTSSIKKRSKSPFRGGELSDLHGYRLAGSVRTTHTPEPVRGEIEDTTSNTIVNIKIA